MQHVLLYNCHVITPKRRSPITALLIKNGIIEEMFSSTIPRIGTAERINLRGNFLVPGFTDSHTHLVSRGVEVQRTDLEQCTSLHECLERLHAALPENDLVFGVNMDDSTWTAQDKDKLCRGVLDALSGTKPIIVRRICGHYAVVNAQALKRIPAGWRVVHRSTGRLYEDSALNLDELFPPSDEMLEKAVDLGIAEALSKGITSVHEITEPQRFRLLQRMKQRHTLSIRFAVYIKLKYFEDCLGAGLSSNLGDDELKFAGIKVYLDGSIGARTAAVSKPYCHSKTRGMLLLTTAHVQRIVERAEDNGIQLMIHAIGDRAVEQALTVFERTIAKRNPLRHRLEHIELITEKQVKTMARLNIIASVQPNFVRRYQQPGGLYEQYLGNRFPMLNPFKKLTEHGVKVLFGSDGIPLGPLYGIHGAILHPSPYERLTRHEALNMYTTEPCFATFDESRKGTIARGRCADLVV